jgi:signal peptidase I
MQYPKTIPVLLAGLALLFGVAGCNQKNMRQASSSMEPTIKQGEVVSVDLAAYSKSTPPRWDVIVYESPISGDGQWLGRVVGLPGESIEIRSGSIVINGKEETLPSHLSIGDYQPAKTENMALDGLSPVTFPFKIPQGSYFVLGDNVSNALDSRYWGALDGSKILGKVLGK